MCAAGMLSRMRDTIGRHSMLPPSGRVVAAVSGGPDSMALLEVLCQFLGDESRDRLVVAHLDHGLREKAPDDADFVREQAVSRGLEFVLGREDVGALARERKLSLEDAARRARYAFLGRVARERGAETVALGHNADDNAETVFLNVFRGSGLRGLAGIRPVRVDVDEAGAAGAAGEKMRYVRPLIDVTRAEIEAFLGERGVPFRTDETNLDTRFRRNLVRNELLPAVRRSLQPRATEVLCRLATLASEARDFVEDEAGPHVREAREGETASLGRAEWQAIPPALRGSVLRLMFERASGGASLSHAHVSALRELLNILEESGEGGEAGEIDLPGGWTATVSVDALSLTPPGAREEPEALSPWRVLVEVPGRVELPDGRVLTAELKEREPGLRPPRSSDPSARVEWADYDALGRPGELVVRSREPGDVFRPFGSAGAKSVKRFLIDLKVPREERPRVPIVTSAEADGGEIVWVAPCRLAERARVTEETREVLVLGLASG